MQDHLSLLAPPHTNAYVWALYGDNLTMQIALPCRILQNLCCYICICPETQLLLQ